jgi:hypothetical protein
MCRVMRQKLELFLILTYDNVLRYGYVSDSCAVRQVGAKFVFRVNRP